MISRKHIFFVFSAIGFMVTAGLIYLNMSVKPVEDEKIPNDWFFAQRAFPQGEINREVYREAQRHDPCGHRGGSDAYRAYALLRSTGCDRYHRRKAWRGRVAPVSADESLKEPTGR